MRSILTHFLLRRTKGEVLKDLPNKTEVVLFHGITELQKKYYKAILLKDLGNVVILESAFFCVT